MSRKRNISFPNNTNNILGILISALIGTVFTFLLTLILSYIISKTSVLPAYLKIYFSICVGLGSIVCGFISSKKCNYKGVISGVLSSIPNLILIFFIILIFSDGQLKLDILIIFFVSILSSSFGGIVGANTKRRK